MINCVNFINILAFIGTMPGKKNNSDKTGNRSNSNELSNAKIIKDVVKNVLADSNILEELIPSCSTSSSNTSLLPTLLQNLKSDEKWLELVSSKVCEYIIQNESFCQIVCDSLSLQFQNQLEKLKNEAAELKNCNKQLEDKLEEQEQYSRRNCLLIHGIPASAGENTDEVALSTIQTHMGISLSVQDVDRSHRLRSKNGPIIIKFTRHNTKNLIYSNKRKLKKTGIVVTESLSTRRLFFIKKLEKLRKEGKITACWSFDGKLFYTLSTDPKKKIELVISNPESLAIFEEKEAKQH